MNWDETKGVMSYCEEARNYHMIQHKQWPQNESSDVYYSDHFTNV